MDSEVLTLGALALVVAGGWLIDVLHQRGIARFRREMARQVKRSPKTLHGAPLH